MRSTLKCGGWMAAIGALLIIFGGTLLPVEALNIWGMPIFFVGLVLIAIGWLPYRTLQRLELNPHELQYDGEMLLFSKRGKPLFKIPEKSIGKLAYLEKGSIYGIAIWLKRPIEEKVRVLQPGFNFSGLMKDSAAQYEGSDIFLPYFTKRSIKALTDLLESDHAS